MKIPCSSCNQRLEIPNNLAGESIKCPSCKETITVPVTQPPVINEPEQKPQNEDSKCVSVQLHETVNTNNDSESQIIQSVESQNKKPWKATLMGVSVIIGGIWAIGVCLTGFIFFFAFALGTLGIGIIFAPLLLLPIYSLVFGIMSIIKGIQMLGENPGPAFRSAKPIFIMAIVNIICCDMLNLFGGIGGLFSLKNDPEMIDWIRKLP